jgi:hypothetical protein
MLVFDSMPSPPAPLQVTLMTPSLTMIAPSTLMP